MELVIDEIKNGDDSLKILYLLADKSSLKGVLTINEASQVHKALVFYAMLLETLKKDKKINDESYQINS